MRYFGGKGASSHIAIQGSIIGQSNCLTSYVPLSYLSNTHIHNVRRVSI